MHAGLLAFAGEEDIDLDRNAQTQPAQASKPPAIIVALTDSGQPTLIPT